MRLKTTCFPISNQSFLPLDEPELLTLALQQVKAGTVSSSSAVAARETASSLLVVCGQPGYAQFAKRLVKALMSCCMTPYSGKREREVMCGKFHQLRCSASFKLMWAKYLKEVTDTRHVLSTQSEATSTLDTATLQFAQTVSQQIFERLVIKRFAVSEKDKCIPTQLSHMELNVVRYTAGYVCRTVKSDVAKTKRKDKEELLFCLMEMSGDEGDEDRGTEDWTNARDRGGLWHISDIAFDLFCAIEEEVRCHLAPEEMTEGVKDIITTAVVGSDDVLFHWCLFGAELDDSQTSYLLGKIVKLYLTSRGHALASACVEEYKQAKNKTLEKGGGLRKELYTTTVCTENNS